MRCKMALLAGSIAAWAAAAPVRGSSVSAPASTATQSLAPDTVTAAVLEDWPPHYQTGPTGQPTGFAVDVLKAVAERADLTVRYTRFETFPEVIQALRTGAVDLVPDLGIVDFRVEEFAFTRPFEAFHLSVFTRASDPASNVADAINGRQVAVVRSNAAIPALLMRYPDAELVTFPSVREALFELLAAGVDAAAYPEEVFRSLARSVDVNDRIRALPEPLLEVSRGMAVAPSDTILRDRLDRAVEALVGSPEYAAIYRRWFTPPEPFWTVERVGWISGLLLVAVLLIMGVWRYVGMARLTERLRETLSSKEAAETARRQEEVRFRTLVEATYEGIIVGDTENRIRFVNRRTCEILGVDAEDVVGSSFLEFVADEHHQRIRDGIRRRREGVSDSYEVRLVRPNGDSVRVLLSVAPILDRDGTFQGSVGALADISELRHAESQLRESEARFRQIAERIDDVFWIATPGKDRLEYISPAYEEIWGRPTASVYEDPTAWSEAIHPEDRERVINALPTQAEGGYEEQYRIVRPDGEVRWIWDRGFPVRNDSGDVVRIVGVAEDITERVEAEQALKEQEQQFRAFVENASDLLSTLDREGRMQYQSPPVKRILGYDPEKLRGESVFDYIHPDDRPEARSAWEEVVHRSGDTFELPAFRFRHEDGSWRILEATLTNLLDDPAVGAVLCNARDVTDRRELEQQLRQTQKLEAVGRLAGGVAHDFNNLLTVIRANAEFLEEVHVPSNPAREHVDEIRQAATRGADLTRQLLAFSRDQVLDPRPTQLNDIVSALERLLRRIIGEDVALAVELSDSLPAIEIDPGQLEQVIMNLAVNARDAMPEGGTLGIVTDTVSLTEAEIHRLGLERSGGHVCLTVRDTGVGMDEATRSKVFEPFFTTKTPESGTGLGLATVHGVVRQSGGAIEIESEPGVGTAFHLYFPTTDKAVERRRVEKPTVVADTTSNGGKLLVVEDDGSVRRVLKKALDRYGFTVVTASSVDGAREALSEDSPGFDLLLTDLVLPDASGLDLIEGVQRDHPGMKVIAISGYSRHEILEERVLGQEVPFLSKPFTPETVATLVEGVLNDRHS